MARPGTVFFGAMAKPLAKQGVADPEGSFQRDADSITRLRMRGLLTETETHRARNRLAKRLRKE